MTTDIMIGANLPWDSNHQDISIVTEQPWAADALCAQVDTDMFFPDKGGSTREAKTICGRCEVRLECLAYALEHDERFGVWGGHSERERRRLKGKRGKAFDCPHCISGFDDTARFHRHLAKAHPETLESLAS